MKIFAVVLAVLLAGCIHRGIDLKTPFNPAQVQYIHSQGEGVITGQAFLNNKGAVNYAAFQKVLLVPISTHALERMQAIYGDSNTQKYSITFNNQSALYFSYQKQTTADALGNFRFENIADGNYYVATQVGGQGSVEFRAVRKQVSVVG
ncbi:MAG: hypothetical protein ACR2O3_12395, partial [Rhizobiaceae bacterium]